MFQTNRRWGGIDRVYEVTAATTIKRGELVGLTSWKLVSCTSGTPFGVAMADWTGWDFIPVALNIPWVEWIADTTANVTAAWTTYKVSAKDKLVADSSTPIFTCTELVPWAWNEKKIKGYFTAHL